MQPAVIKVGRKGWMGPWSSYRSLTNIAKALNCPRNEMKMKQFQNSLETVFLLLCQPKLRPGRLVIIGPDLASGRRWPTLLRLEAVKALGLRQCITEY